MVSFDEAKALVTSAPCLTYYDVKAQVVLQGDALDYGLGAANNAVTTLLTIKPSLKPITYSSKSLTLTKVGYTQIEKECLVMLCPS